MHPMHTSSPEHRTTCEFLLSATLTGARAVFDLFRKDGAPCVNAQGTLSCPSTLEIAHETFDMSRGQPRAFSEASHGASISARTLSTMRGMLARWCKIEEMIVNELMYYAACCVAKCGLNTCV